MVRVVMTGEMTEVAEMSAEEMSAALVLTVVDRVAAAAAATEVVAFVADVVAMALVSVAVPWEAAAPVAKGMVMA